MRNGFYAASAVRFLGDALQSGRVELPEDGPVTWTTHADLAEAAAVILADEGCFDGPTPPLTASEALTFADIAGVATEVAGRAITRVTMSDGRFPERLMDRGVPAEAAAQLLGVFAASRAGEFAAVDPTLAELIGRRPSGVDAVLRELSSV
ncbi:hypothetical protein APR08_000606 [Nocardia amikacinitolerans]|nr:hypothetical protein [Nocardia amikacinitolerans]